MYCLSYWQSEEQRFIEQIFLSDLEKREFITHRNIFSIVINFNLLSTCQFLFALSSGSKCQKSMSGIKVVKKKEGKKFECESKTFFLPKHDFKVSTHFCFSHSFLLIATTYFILQYLFWLWVLTNMSVRKWQRRCAIIATPFHSIVYESSHKFLNQCGQDKFRRKIQQILGIIRWGQTLGFYIRMLKGWRCLRIGDM